MSGINLHRTRKALGQLLTRFRGLCCTVPILASSPQTTAIKMVRRAGRPRCPNRVNWYFFSSSYEVASEPMFMSLSQRVRSRFSECPARILSRGMQETIDVFRCLPGYERPDSTSCPLDCRAQTRGHRQSYSSPTHSDLPEKVIWPSGTSQ